MPKTTPPIDPTIVDPTDPPDVENHSGRVVLTQRAYAMTPKEQRIYAKLKAACPLTMVTVVAIRETSSHHWEVLYADGAWALVVSIGGVAIPNGDGGGLTHLGPDREIRAILSAV